MKDLSNYLTEKLKLSDINKDYLYDGEWLDVKNFKGIEDLKEGNIVKMESGKLFVVVPTDLAKRLPREPRDFITDYDYFMIRFEKTLSGSPMYPRMYFESYKHDFPYSGSYKIEFKIKEINTRIKKYKNLHDLEEDIKNIAGF